MTIAKKYKILFSNKRYLLSSMVGFFLLGASLVVQYFAGLYATLKASNSVTDLLLDILPVFDVDGFFIYSAFALLGFILILVWRQPERLPFVAKSIALFVLTRSLFMTFTHLGAVPEGIALPADNPIRWITFGGDLFFSGHVGMPFLMALVFWKEKVYRYIFLAFSCVSGAVVLLGHFHYSIDVFAAFFITYGIYDLAKLFFAKDLKFFSLFEKAKN